MNIFKIRVNNINNSDKSGLYFGLSRSSYNFSKSPYDEEWNISCNDTHYNSKFNSFKREEINKGDIVTFIVDLNIGSLSVKKNDITIGKLSDIPTNEDLVPCVCNYFMENILINLND